MLNRGKLASHIYEALLSSALVGVLSTCSLASVLVQAFGTQPDVPSLGSVNPYPWYVGTIGGFLYAVFCLPRLRAVGTGLLPRTEKHPSGLIKQPQEAPTVATGPKPRSDAAGVALLGALAGAYFGSGLLIFWLWSAASPCAWSQAVSNEIRLLLIASDLPLAVYLLGIPILFGALIGFVGRTNVIRRNAIKSALSG